VALLVFALLLTSGCVKRNYVHCESYFSWGNKVDEVRMAFSLENADGCIADRESAPTRRYHLTIQAHANHPYRIEFESIVVHLEDGTKMPVEMKDPILTGKKVSSGVPKDRVFS
jgi:hypothetical protein